MVRVISVHHFAGQDVHTCDEPVAVASAPPDRLLLALPHHAIEVRDLAKGGGAYLTFPTVDQVRHILHCCRGDYVATLETKRSRQGKDTTYARIYANWANGSQEEGVTQAMRARIAGRVTPSSTQSGSVGLEMIELPLRRAPTAIACCQTSGHLVVAAHATLSFFLFRMRTHDISRQRFLDFEEWTVSVELSFSPSRLGLCEGIVAAQGPHHTHVFSVGGELDNQGQTPQDETVPANNKPAHNGPIDLDQLEKEAYPPTTVCLPTIAAERAKAATSPSPGTNVVHRYSPFCVAPPNMTVTVRCSSPPGPCSQDCAVSHLLQLHMMTDLELGETAGQPGQEEFRCLLLQPVFLRGKTSTSREAPPIVETGLRSTARASLVGLVCLVASQQEGYLYHFSLRGPPVTQQDACVTVYPFTAPVSAVAMERYLLHALTDTGLETYTLRTGLSTMRAVQPLVNNITACPPEEPVCLVGLRPFLGVEHLLVTDRHLALLACSEGSSASSQESAEGGWTLYSLRLPTPSALYTDVMGVALPHRDASPATYGHLLAEAHLMLWAALTTETRPGEGENGETPAELYRESCALLGDFYVTGEGEAEWCLAAPYYRMAGLSALQVVERVQRMGEPRERWARGLLEVLRASLLLLGDDTFAPAVPQLAHALLDLFETHAPHQVAALVLRSRLLREHATERALGIVRTQMGDMQHPDAQHSLALAMLCLQKSFHKDAVSALLPLSDDTLRVTLMANHRLLFERSPSSTSFSELGSLLAEHRPGVLAAVLASLATGHPPTVPLPPLLAVLLDWLPAHLPGAGRVLQGCLEHYLSEMPLDSEPEATRLLVRSYLGELRCRKPLGPPTGPAPHADARPRYLDRMPPFAADFSQRLLGEPKNKDDPAPITRGDDHRSLVRLQGLLASGQLPPECVAEVGQFLTTPPPPPGHLSLQVLCVPPRQALLLLLDFCPQALLQFTKDKLSSEGDYKFLLVLLQRKVAALDDADVRKPFYLQVSRDVMMHLAQNLSLEELIRVLPPGDHETYQRYLRTCQQVAHANHMRALIMATGQQLLSSLNL